MTIKVLVDYFKINPAHFSGSFELNLHSEILKRVKGKCDEKNGYIMELLEINKILDNTIHNSSSDIILKVKFTVRNFKPYKGLISVGKVCAIYNDGILAKIDTQKVLIPASTYKNTDKGDVKIDDSINLKITNVRYADHSFSCLAEIV